MKKYLAILMVVIATGTHSAAQRVVMSNPGRLIITGQTIQGNDFIAESSDLQMTASGNLLYGKLDPGTLSSDDPGINDIISKIGVEEIRFECRIGQDFFTFSENENKKIDLEGELITGDYVDPIIMEFIVSNRLLDNKSNFFMIVGKGLLSVSRDFGLTDQQYVRDELKYNFSINMQVRTR